MVTTCENLVIPSIKPPSPPDIKYSQYVIPYHNEEYLVEGRGVKLRGGDYCFSWKWFRMTINPTLFRGRLIAPKISPMKEAMCLRSAAMLQLEKWLRPHGTLHILPYWFHQDPTHQYFIKGLQWPIKKRCYPSRSPRSVRDSDLEF